MTEQMTASLVLLHMYSTSMIIIIIKLQAPKHT